MSRRRGFLALTGAAVGVGAGLIAQHSMVKRRRRSDPEAGEQFGTRRGIRQRTIPISGGGSIFIEEAGPEARRGAIFVHGSALRTDVWHYQLPGIDLIGDGDVRFGVVNNHDGTPVTVPDGS